MRLRLAEGRVLMEIIDISLPLDKSLAVWPGDTEFDYELVWKRSAGASVNVGSVRMSTHFGTHVDAPFHFDDAGQKIDELPPATFMGKAFVIHFQGQQQISKAMLSKRDFQGATRVLLRTDAWIDHHTFPERIPLMDPDVPDWLGSQGIVLIGLDLPSVDAIDSKELPIHHALARNGITILESLDLSRVDEGVYNLVALPLKVAGGDAAPVRAVLTR
jgi:arylformamidase